MNQELFFIVAFLGAFEVVGGIALGSGLRSLIKGQLSQDMFLIVWGAGFGGIPLVMNAAFTLTSRTPLLFFVGPALFGGAILIGFLVLPTLLANLGAGALITLGMGVLFLTIGLGVGVSMLMKREVFVGLLTGGTFTLVGALLCAVGIGPLLQGKSALE